MKWKETKSPSERASYTEFLSGDPELTRRMRALLEGGVPVRFRTRGLSMSPFIKTGDVVTISPLEGKRPQLGDIALCSIQNQGLLIHRIIRSTSKRYTTKGDNCFTADGPIQRSDVLGLVTRVEREGVNRSLGFGPGRAFLALLSRFNLFLYLVVPLWMMVRTLAVRGRP